MKADIHPQYYEDVKVTCACGNILIVGSTTDKISVEICSACHPFYTDVEKVVDTAGRVEKFKVRRTKAAEAKAKTSRAGSPLGDPSPPGTGKDGAPGKPDEPKVGLGKTKGLKKAKAGK